MDVLNINGVPIRSYTIDQLRSIIKSLEEEIESRPITENEILEASYERFNKYPGPKPRLDYDAFVKTMKTKYPHLLEKARLQKRREGIATVEWIIDEYRATSSKEEPPVKVTALKSVSLSRCGLCKSDHELMECQKGCGYKMCARCVNFRSGSGEMRCVRCMRNFA